MTLLEATVVNVALPAIGPDLAAGVAGLQWTLDGYVLTLAALVLPVCSLGDIYGRRRVFVVGAEAFAVASAYRCTLWVPRTPSTESDLLVRCQARSGMIAGS
jgi:MFS family permease